MSYEPQLAEAYCKLLTGIDWSDKLLVAGIREGLNKFLSNAFLSLFTAIQKYHRTHFISPAALERIQRKVYRDLIYEHMIPKTKYVQRPCEELARKGELTVEFVQGRLERYWRTATITKTENCRLHPLEMPEDWDSKNTMARYSVVGIELQPNPFCPKPFVNFRILSQKASRQCHRK